MDEGKRDLLDYCHGEALVELRDTASLVCGHDCLGQRLEMANLHVLRGRRRRDMDQTCSDLAKRRGDSWVQAMLLTSTRALEHFL